MDDDRWLQVGLRFPISVGYENLNLTEGTEQQQMPAISVPKGVLRLAALKMLSESSLSGTDLANQIRRVTSGEWSPGPGSIYLILGELKKKGQNNELPKRGWHVRR